MNTFHAQDKVADIVTRNPALSRIFEQAGIDYCCGGWKTLEQASREKARDPSELLDQLNSFHSQSDQEVIPDFQSMAMTELADHIEQTHHAFLKSELPRLDAITEKVAQTHGDKDERLSELRQTFVALKEAMLNHLFKEETILFPMIRQLKSNDTAPVFHCGHIHNPIRQMEMEHEATGNALEALRGLTDDYTAPDWACATHRAMIDGLLRLELDTHHHIHKENNILFIKAIQKEAELNKDLHR